MQNMEKLLNKSEKLFEKNISIFTAWIIVQRYYAAFVVHKNINYIHKAYHAAVVALNKNPNDITLLLYITYLDIKLENYDSAERNLKDISLYKNYFKNNEPIAYGGFLYLSIINNFYMEKNRTAVKLVKSFTDFRFTFGPYSTEGKVLSLLMGNILLEFGEDSDALESAGESFVSAYNGGLRSMFLFANLYKYFSLLERDIYGLDVLLVPFLNWGLTHNVDLSKIIDTYKEKIIFYFRENNLGFNLYKTYPNEWLLKEICREFIYDLDYSENAFYFYKEAVIKQIELDNLNAFFVKSAFKNKIEDISIYPIKIFLASKSSDMEIKPYIYHIILSNKKYNYLAQKYEFDILEYGFYALEKNLTGRYYNSIYKFILSNEKTNSVTFSDIAKAEKFLHSQLFLYDLEFENKDIRYLWIKEKEKNKMEIYNVINGKATIRAVSEKFTYYCLDYEQKNILSSSVKILKLVENTDIKLYLRFYDKKYVSSELLISIAKYYLNVEFPSRECIPILDYILKEGNISKMIKVQVADIIGNIYYNNNEYTKAVQYYKNTEDKYLTDKSLENIFKAFISMGEMDYAINLLIKKSHILSDRTVFYAVKKIAKEKKYHNVISDICYQLLLKSWYDQSFIDIVLEYYKGSQREWQELNKILLSMAIKEQRVQELIIKNGIWMHKFNSELQNVFVEMANSDPYNKLIYEFIDFCGYEIIINSTKIEADTIKTLEKIFLKDEYKLLAYTLCHVYINQNISTVNSNFIINKTLKFMEEDDIIFPIFKEFKDKSFHSPYIEKNQPFIYRTTPNKNVLLYFKAYDRNEFDFKPMKYFGFGLYIVSIPIFYCETIVYYISEQMENGSIETQKKEIKNNNMYIHENSIDSFYDINNALIYDIMFKYDKVEEIINKKLRETKEIKGKLL